MASALVNTMQQAGGSLLPSRHRLAELRNAAAAPAAGPGRLTTTT